MFEVELRLTLQDKGSLSGNGGKSLRIDGKRDSIWYGEKEHVELAEGRTTTCESDIFILREGLRIGVDAKHARTETYKAQVAPRQIDAVVEAIVTGKLSEFHFVTNGVFRQGERERIEAASDLCETRLADARREIEAKPLETRTLQELKVLHGSRPAGPLICWHEGASGPFDADFLEGPEDA